MEVATLIFLSSGLFLGWSLGANHLGNVFGTAVGTRMITFMTAAVLCSVFVILGSVISGAGAAGTLVKLGAVNALAGAFMIALSGALAVYWMTKFGMPVSTTETLVGAIIGWNLFTGFLIDIDSVVKIVLTWVVCPFLSAIISMLYFKLTTYLLRKIRPHLLRQDAYTRLGLIVAGSFGAYSLGANNIGNVMGIFIPVSPFTDFRFGDAFTFSSVQQLFLLGGVAIAVGVLTYSRKVIHTVGHRLFNLTPVAAWVVVMAHSTVLFLFASEGLEHMLAEAGLPTIPLVPVSSSQAVVGSVIGIGLVQGARRIRWRIVVNIASAWITSPVIAGVVCFVGLFIVQNVFNQQVARPVVYALSDTVLTRLEADGVDVGPVRDLTGRRFYSPAGLSDALDQRVSLDHATLKKFVTYAEVDTLVIDDAKFDGLDGGLLTAEQRAAVARLAGRTFTHRWMFDEALMRESDAWKPLPQTKVNKLYNRDLEEKRRALYALFRIE
ncbi:MAG: inorganic phosphate transporter [Alphaproteobacteria bacterium]